MDADQFVAIIHISLQFERVLFFSFSWTTLVFLSPCPLYEINEVSMHDIFNIPFSVTPRP